MEFTLSEREILTMSLAYRSLGIREMLYPLYAEGSKKEGYISDLEQQDLEVMMLYRKIKGEEGLRPYETPRESYEERLRRKDEMR